jgi:hypothetical protein
MAHISYAYSSYRGRSVGRIMHFLYSVNHRFDDSAKIGNKIIYDGYSRDGKGNGPIMATFEWDGESDVPIFKFTEPYAQYQQIMDEVTKLILEDEKRYGIEPWNEAQEKEKEERKKEERRKALHESIMKGIQNE